MRKSSVKNILAEKVQKVKELPACRQGQRGKEAKKLPYESAKNNTAHVAVVHTE